MFATCSVAVNQSHQALDAANQSEGERDWFFWVWRPQILAKMSSGPKRGHLLYIEDDISYLVICGDDISHSGLGPFFFCSERVAVGELNVLQFFLRRFFFANHLFFPSVFFVCAGGHSNLTCPPCVHGILCADCLQNKALYIL